MPARIVERIEDLRSLAGQEIGVSDWVTVTQETINRFADVTGDHQWIHIDAARAGMESPYGTTIAHGFLTLSLLSDLSRQAVEIQGDFSRRINYGLNKVRFPAGVPAGGRIRGRFKLKTVEDVDGGVQIVWDCTVELEGSVKPALAAEWLTRLYF